MTVHETFADTALVREFRALMVDSSDLLQKEMRLARAELSERVALQVRAGIWFAIAGVLAFVILLLIVEAAVFGLASRGIDMHWSCLIVGGVLAVAAAIAYFAGRSVRADIKLARTTRQINETVRTAKELLQ